MITLYNNVYVFIQFFNEYRMKQRKIMGIQLTNELKEEERIQAHLVFFSFFTYSIESKRKITSCFSDI